MRGSARSSHLRPSGSRETYPLLPPIQRATGTGLETGAPWSSFHENTLSVAGVLVRGKEGRRSAVLSHAKTLQVHGDERLSVAAHSRSPKRDSNDRRTNVARREDLVVIYRLFAPTARSGKIQETPLNLEGLSRDCQTVRHLPFPTSEVFANASRWMLSPDIRPVCRSPNQTCRSC